MPASEVTLCMLAVLVALLCMVREWALNARFRRLLAQRDSIKELLGSASILTGNFPHAAGEITQAASVTGAVDAKIWLGDQRDRSLRLTASLAKTALTTIPFDACAEYFEAIFSEQTIALTPVANHHPLAALAKQNLCSSSLAQIHAPIRLNGRTVGVIWIELAKSRRSRIAEITPFLVELAKIAAIALAIHRRKEAELLSSAREARFREFVHMLPQIAFETNAQGVFVYVNRAIFSVTGYTQDEAINSLSLFALCVPSSAAKMRENFVQLAAGEVPTGFDYPMRRQDGTLFQGLVYAAVFGFDSDGPTGYRGTIIDISERRRAEDALRETERRLTQIINFLPDATVIINHKKEVVYWNRAIEVMTGVSAEQMLGKSNFEWAIPFYGERRPILLDLVCDRVVGFENKYITLDKGDDNLVGEAFIPCLGEGGSYLLGAARALFDSEGRFAGAIESIRDVSARKRAEIESDIARKELEESYQSLKSLLRQQEINIEMAQQVLFLINSQPVRHTELAGDLELYVTSHHVSCHATGGDHSFVKTIDACGGKGRRTILSVKDQSGHDVGCVLYDIIVDLIHNALLRDPRYPTTDAVVSRLNRIICSSGVFAAESFFTAFCAELDHATLQLRYLSAGHPPCLLIRDLRVHLLPGEDGKGANLPIGVMMETTFDSDIIELKEGDQLLFYTDGLLELPRRHGRQGMTSRELRLLVQKQVLLHPHSGVLTILNNILQALGAPTEPADVSSCPDDVALLGVELERVQHRFQTTLHPQSMDDLGQSIENLARIITEEWAHFGIDNPEQRLRIVLEETLVNAWKHGNQGDSNKAVVINRAYGNDAMIEVIDQGEGFSFEDVADPTHGENRRKTSGRGLYMIRMIADDVEWRDKGRVIRVYFQSQIRSAARLGGTQQNKSRIHLDLWP